MKFERTLVSGFEGAIRGMRNPLESWSRSDSRFGFIDNNYDTKAVNYRLKDAAEAWFTYNESLRENIKNFKEKSISDYESWLSYNNEVGFDFDNNIEQFVYIGPHDMRLMQRLIKAGGEHRKFMRQIQVSVDITAPLYWWKEADTYRVGVTTNSTSTMHKLATTPITIDCFETDDYTGKCLYLGYIEESNSVDFSITSYISFLERLRLEYLKTKDKKYWKELIRWLPESWLQTRTVTMNYENIYSMVKQRKNHKLTEWSESFMDWVELLPYANELLFLE